MLAASLQHSRYVGAQNDCLCSVFFEVSLSSVNASEPTNLPWISNRIYATLDEPKRKTILIKNVDTLCAKFFEAIDKHYNTDGTPAIFVLINDQIRRPCAVDTILVEQLVTVQVSDGGCSRKTTKTKKTHRFFSQIYRPSNAATTQNNDSDIWTFVVYSPSTALFYQIDSKNSSQMDLALFLVRSACATPSHRSALTASLNDSMPLYDYWSVKAHFDTTLAYAPTIAVFASLLVAVIVWIGGTLALKWLSQTELKEQRALRAFTAALDIQMERRHQQVRAANCALCRLNARLFFRAKI